MTSTSQAQQISDLQDAQLANVMSDLSSDPARRSTFIAEQKSKVFNTVVKEHSGVFNKVYGDMTRASDGTSNILYYHTRNKDLDNTQEAILSKTKSEANAVATDSQNAKRQFEINEWTSNNKMDTLFFFQLLLIVLTLMAPLLYVNRIGLIPETVYYGVSCLIGIAVVLTLIVRFQYTSQVRDNRFWNRRKFAQMGGPPTISCPSLQGIEDSANAAYTSINSSVTDAVVSTKDNVRSSLNAWTSPGPTIAAPPSGGA